MKRQAFIIIFIVCAAGAISLFFLFRDPIFADQSRGTLLSEKPIENDLNHDGRKETITLSSYKKNDKNLTYITISTSILNKPSVELTGFEDNVRFCDQNIYQFENDSVVCMLGEVGVHSENIQFIGYKDGRIAIIPFKNGSSESPNATSDQPKFSLSDSTASKIIIENRNYDLNPLSDVIQTTYQYRNGVFTFIGSKDIVYSNAL